MQGSGCFYTKIKSVTLCFLFLTLVGCTVTPSISQDIPSPANAEKITAESLPGKDFSQPEKSRKVNQCNSELAALQRVNVKAFNRHRAAMDKLIDSGRLYLSVQNSVSPEINDILQPRFQFLLADLCWRIRSELTASLIQDLNRSSNNIRRHEQL